MPPKPRRIWSLDDLSDYVNETLCHHEQLELGCFQLTEKVLYRGDRPCGIYFCLHGPRQVRLTAIWAKDRNMLYFYGATGERYHTVRLPDGAELNFAPAVEAETATA
jgi:hypothetical protein